MQMNTTQAVEGRLKPLDESTVVIVGLGLMGASLAGALRGHCRSVVGLARRSETICTAKQRALIDEGTTDPRIAFQQADIVVLATPVRTIIQQVHEFAPLLPPQMLLLDLGSTKTDILAAMADLGPGIQPLGAHPMCGKETSGSENADPYLYRGCTFILCPLERTSPSAVALGETLIRAVGAKPLLLEGERQDRLIASLSHLPYLLACSLVQTANVMTSSDPAAWEIVANGFRDTSRVAGSDVAMMLDILCTNREEVLKAARAFRTQFDRLVMLVENQAEDELAALLTQCREERRRMYP